MPVTETSWNDAIQWNIRQMAKDVALFTKLYSFPIDAEFDQNGYAVEGTPEPSTGERVTRNWTWLQDVIARLYGRRYRLTLEQEQTMRALLGEQEAARRLTHSEEPKPTVLVQSPLHVWSVAGVGSHAELQAAVNLARATIGEGPMDVTTLAMDVRARSDPYANCTHPKQLPKEIRRLRISWFGWNPLMGMRSHPLSGPPSHVMNMNELLIPIEDMGYALADGTEDHDEEGVRLLSNGSSNEERVLRWLERHDDVLPDIDTPDFDRIMYLAAQSKNMGTLYERNPLLNGERVVGNRGVHMVEKGNGVRHGAMDRH